MMLKHKFNAKPVRTNDGKYFASKLQYRYHQQLLLRQKAGDVVMFLPEVSIPLVFDAEKNKWIKYRVDFIEFLKDGTCIFTEVKGMETKEYKIKKALFEDLYPVKLNVVKKV